MSESNYSTVMAPLDVSVLSTRLRKSFQPVKNTAARSSTEASKTPRNPPCRTQQSLRMIGVAKLLWAFNVGVKRGEEMDTSVEKGLSQGFLHCKRDYGSSTTYYAEIEGSEGHLF